MAKTEELGFCVRRVESRLDEVEGALKCFQYSHRWQIEDVSKSSVGKEYDRIDFICSQCHFCKSVTGRRAIKRFWMQQFRQVLGLR